MKTISYRPSSTLKWCWLIISKHYLTILMTPYKKQSSWIREELCDITRHKQDQRWPLHPHWSNVSLWDIKWIPWRMICREEEVRSSDTNRAMTSWMFHHRSNISRYRCTGHHKRNRQYQLEETGCHQTEKGTANDCDQRHHEHTKYSPANKRRRPNQMKKKGSSTSHWTRTEWMSDFIILEADAWYWTGTDEEGYTVNLEFIYIGMIYLD